MTLDFENLGDFFNVSEFAQDVTLDPSGTPRVIQVIFDELPFADAPGELDIAGGTQPAILSRSADLAGVAQDTRLGVGTTTYRIIDFIHDGTGLTRVLLQKV